MAQLRQKHETNAKLLQRNEILSYQQSLATSLQTVEAGDSVEGMWKTLKDAVTTAQNTPLPLVTSKPEADLMNDEVHQLSQRKQQAWLSWKKNIDNLQARNVYKKLKKLKMLYSREGQECLVGRTGIGY